MLLVFWGRVVRGGGKWRPNPERLLVSRLLTVLIVLTMSLTGTYHRTLDEKQRLAVPKKLKDGLVSETDYTVYLAPETDRALTLYSGREFERRASLLVDLAAQRAEVRNYQRMYYSQAEQVEIDGQGRIRLPERLIEFAGIQQEVVLLGVHNHVEIWDRTRWSDFLERHRQDFDAMSNAALG